MCRKYDIPRHTFSSRIKAGWSVEKALTTKAQAYAVPCVDYLGRTFNTCRDMANFYNVPEFVFQNQILRNKDFKTTITRAYKKGQKFGTMIFSKFINFPYLEINKDNNTIVIDIETLLEAYHNSEDFNPIPDRKTNNGITDINRIGFPIYRATVDGQERICSYWQIIEYCWKNNYGMCKKKKKMKRTMIIYDHLGNKFNSLSAMLDKYVVTYVPFMYRLEKMHMSLKDALTSPIAMYDSTAIKCTDHLGNSFRTKADMCDYWRIPRHVYFSRIRSGWSDEKALTTPITKANQTTKKKTWTDHEGNKFDSIEEMCEHWNISKRQYMINIRNNCSIKDALTTVTEWTVCKDHLGNEYPSINAMCKHYGITKTTLRARIELGWTLEEILENPGKHINYKSVKDHLGNTYPSMKAMLDHYGTNYMTFKHRISKGHSLKDSLTKNFHIKKCKDHLGNEFAMLSDMLMYWNTKTGTFHKRCDDGLPMEECLCKINTRQNYGPNLKIIKKIDEDYYEIEFEDKPFIWSKSQIFDYYRKNCLPNEGKDLIIGRDKIETNCNSH